MMNLVSCEAYDLLSRATCEPPLKRFIYDTFHRVFPDLVLGEDCAYASPLPPDVKFFIDCEHLVEFAPLIEQLKLRMHRMEYDQENLCGVTSELLQRIPCHERVIRSMGANELHAMIPDLFCTVITLHGCDLSSVPLHVLRTRASEVRIHNCYVTTKRNGSVIIDMFSGTLVSVNDTISLITISGAFGVRYFDDDIIRAAKELHLTGVGEYTCLTLAAVSLSLHTTRLTLDIPAHHLCNLRMELSAITNASPAKLPRLETLEMHSSWNLKWAGYPFLRIIQASPQFGKLEVVDNPLLELLQVQDMSNLTPALLPRNPTLQRVEVAEWGTRAPVPIVHTKAMKRPYSWIA